MTSAAVATSPELVEAAQPAAQRGVVGRVLARPGAWIGCIWLGIVALAGGVAPFLASSHPWKMVLADGRVEYPLFEYLTPADVAIPMIALLILAAVVVQRWVSPRWVWGGCVALSVVTAGACWWWVDPPEITIYERSRVMLATGEAVSATYTLIPYSPSDRFRDQPNRALDLPLPPNSTHLMGTDRAGADLLSRMIHASRVALAVGFIATGIALVIGVVLGGLMGYFFGIVDLIGMRLVEVFSAIPVFFLLLTFVAFFPRNLYIMMVIIGCTGWVGYARFVRAEFFKLRAMDFVQAGRACGLPLWSILFRHMLPNAVAPVLVAASFGVPSAILYEATLSFLGLGLVDEPSWGQMLSQATGAGGGFYWWIAAFPGLAIFLTVFGFNLFGEALRDVVDVKS
ncbi:MAG: ABC transporter permease [Planctomycetota bacterium]